MLREVLCLHARVDTKHDDVIQAALAMFDEAMHAHYAKLSCKGVTWRQWLAQNKNACGGIMPLRDIQAVLDVAGEDFRGVSKELARLENLTRTGKAVFSFARNMLASDIVKTSIEEKLIAIEGRLYTDEAVKEALVELAKQDGQMDKKGVTKKREVGVDLCGMLAKLPVFSAVAEFEYRFFTHVKHESLGRKDGLDPFDHEKIMAADVLTSARAAEPCPVLQRTNSAAPRSL